MTQLMEKPTEIRSHRMSRTQRTTFGALALLVMAAAAYVIRIYAGLPDSEWGGAAWIVGIPAGITTLIFASLVAKAPPRSYGLFFAAALVCTAAIVLFFWTLAPMLQKPDEGTVIRPHKPGARAEKQTPAGKANTPAGVKQAVPAKSR